MFLPNMQEPVMHVCEDLEFNQVYEVQSFEIETVKREHVEFTHVPPHAHAVLKDVQVMNISQENIIEFHEVTEILEEDPLNINEPNYVVQASGMYVIQVNEAEVVEHLNEDYSKIIQDTEDKMKMFKEAGNTLQYNIMKEIDMENSIFKKMKMLNLSMAEIAV